MTPTEPTNASVPPPIDQTTTDDQTALPPKELAGNGNGNGWSGDIPSVLRQPEGRARLAAAVGGIVLGVCVALLCFFLIPPANVLGRMFDFHQVQVFVPVSILTVFFWGLFLCMHRRQRLKACEKVSSFTFVAKATEALKKSGLPDLSQKLGEPNVEFNPLLCRLRGLINQWQLKPGLMEADLVLQQFVFDDEEATRRAYSLVRTFVWALPVLGLIGTVLGIAFAVGGFASFLGGRVDDVEAIKKSLVGVTGGLSFAFLLTLLGLATSLVLMLLASGLETREERLYQTIQQQIVGTFLPELQRVCPAEDAGKTRVETIIDPIRIAAEALLSHVAQLAEAHTSRLALVLEAQQSKITDWGQGLQDQASSAAAVLKTSLDDAARNLRDGGGEFLARLDLVRQTWKEQTDILQSALAKQTLTNQALSSELKDAAQQQSQASQTLAGTLQSMQSALSSSASVVHSLELALRKLADSPMEQVATSMVKTLENVVVESDKITKALTVLNDSTRQTLEAQRSVQAAVKQLDDAKLIETLDAFRKALTRHADVVEKLNSGLKLTLNV